jgi:hypothetical protein
MSHTRTQLSQARDLLLKINHHLSLKNPASFLPGEATDLAEVSKLIRLVEVELTNYNEKAVNDDFKTGLVQFLKARWARIANTPLCYTLNQSHPFNVACILLATYMDPAGKNTLLMPTVAMTDIFGYEFNKLELGEFVLDDKHAGFITIEALVQSACSRMLESESQLYVTTNEQGQTRPLTQAETSRCGRLIPIINSVEAWYRQHRGTCLDMLGALRNSLLRGDVAHGGVELDAGNDANVGIANFHEFYSAMNEEEQRQLRAFGDGTYTIGYVLNRLFRPADENFREVRYCIQSLGRLLQSIIEANAIELSGLSSGINSRNLQNLIDITKAQLGGYDLTFNSDASLIPRNQRVRSKLNPELTFNENEYVVSYIAPKSSYFFPVSSKIIVEGVKNGRIFVGSYYSIAQTGKTWLLLPDQMQNTSGIFTKVKAFECYGYAQIPQTNRNGELNINDSGIARVKYDQITELRNSLSRSHQVPVQNVEDMIKSIKSDAMATDFAHWVYGNTPSLSPDQVDDILADDQRRSLYVPFERFGKYSFFGAGKNNYVTWCEDKLAIAGCGQSSCVDNVKAKPIMHVKLG